MHTAKIRPYQKAGSLMQDCRPFKYIQFFVRLLQDVQLFKALDKLVNRKINLLFRMGSH